MKLNITQNQKELINALGTFWSSFFLEQDQLKTFLDAWSCIGEQGINDFNELVQNTFVKTCNAFHTVKYKPIKIYKNELNVTESNYIKYGENNTYTAETELYYGKKKSTTMYSFPLVNEIKNFIGVTDTIKNPSFFKFKGDDVTITNDTITFKENPFSVLDSKKEITGTNLQEYISLIILNAEIDINQLQTSFGEILGLDIAESSYYLKNIIENYWNCLITGCTSLNIYKLIGSILNVPVSNETETIIDAGENETTAWIVTNKHIYKSNKNSKFTKKPGEKVYIGEFLTTAAKLIKPENAATELKGITLGKNYTNNITKYDLTFVNSTNCPISIESATRHTFKILGNSDDITNFWNEYYRRCDEKGINGVTLLDGCAENNNINPMEFVINNILKHNHIFLNINANELDVPKEALKRLNLIQKINNPHSAIFLILNTEIKEDTLNITQIDEELKIFKLGFSSNDIITLAKPNISNVLIWDHINSGATNNSQYPVDLENYTIKYNVEGLINNTWTILNQTNGIITPVENNTFTIPEQYNNVKYFRVCISTYDVTDADTRSQGNVRGYNLNYGYNNENASVDTNIVLKELINIYPSNGWYVLPWNTTDLQNGEYYNVNLGDETATITQDNPKTIPIPTNVSLTTVTESITTSSHFIAATIL